MSFLTRIPTHNLTALRSYTQVVNVFGRRNVDTVKSDESNLAAQIPEIGVGASV